MRVFSTENPTSFQSKLFNSAKTYFGYDKEILIISKLDDFNFNPAIRQLIKLLNTKIENSKNLASLTIQNSIAWLKTYLKNLQDNTEFKSLLEFGNIIPNRKDNFCPINDIKSFGTVETPLDDELIKILFNLNNEENWDEFLIHDSFRELDLKNKKFDELANKILDELKQA